jgi:hypothetical protein
MYKRMRLVALALTAAAAVAIAGGVTHAITEIGGGGEQIATTPSGNGAEPDRPERG